MSHDYHPPRKSLLTGQACRGCRPKKLGYVAWHEDAVERSKRGEQQAMCPACGLWRWPNELRKPAPYVNPPGSDR